MLNLQSNSRLKLISKTCTNIQDARHKVPQTQLVATPETPEYPISYTAGR